jgi:Sap, sulfolipid-1-addressing protein
VVLPPKRGVVKGAAFVFGWLVSLGIVVTITVLATGNNPPQPNTAPSLASLAVKIALGVVLVVIAVRHIRARSKPKPPKKPPKWQEHVVGMVAVIGRQRAQPVRDKNSASSNSLANSRSSWPGRATDSSSRRLAPSPRSCGVSVSLSMSPTPRAAGTA